jgi:DNA invertase Pin-like site-specific DNA recombinase
MKRVAIYARVSTDKAQTVENQLRQLNEVAVRLGWMVVAVFTDEGISGAKGRDKRPGFDALLKGVARKEFDLIAAWSVCRLGRSLQDLVGFLADIQNREIGLYLHVQGLDTSTPSVRLMFSMLSVFSDYERAMIRERVMAGLARVRGHKKLGRPPMTQDRIQAITTALMNGKGIRATARETGASTTSVMRISRSLTVSENRSNTVDNSVSEVSP